VNPRAVRAISQLTSIFAVWGDTLVGAMLDQENSRYGIELMEVNLRTGDTVRLTRSPADDFSFSLSPDNRFGAFLSARNGSEDEYSSIYIMDRADGSTRRLTSSPNWDVMPSWSPDGARIAFMRRYDAARPTEVCWVLTSGAEERCLPPSTAFDVTGVGAWDSEYSLIVLAERHDSATLVVLRVDVDAGSYSELGTAAETFSIEPGGVFGFTQRAQTGTGSTVGMLFLVDAPAREVPLRFSREVQGQLFRSLAWVRRRKPEQFRGELQIVNVPDTVRLDAIARLRATARRLTERRLLAAPEMRWRSLDTTVAVVSANDGAVSPVRAGEVRIMVSAAGYQPDTIALVVGAKQFAGDVFTETWATLDATRWLSVGEPAVSITTTDAGDPALLLNGDEFLRSGVYQRRAVDASAGVGFEAQVYAPVTASHWQSITLQLAAVASDDELNAWGQSAAARQPILPSLWAESETPRLCFLSVPRGEGGDKREQIGFWAGGHAEPLKRLPTSLVDGAWHTVRLQVFADGRCGLAVDGEVMAISERALPTNKPLRVVLEGQSVRARMLVGKLSMWRGERLDLPWFATPASAP
jgi:hypothetical protein